MEPGEENNPAKQNASCGVLGWLGVCWAGTSSVAAVRGSHQLETCTGAGGAAFGNGANQRNVRGLLLQGHATDENATVAAAADACDGSSGADVFLGHNWVLCSARGRFHAGMGGAGQRICTNNGDAVRGGRFLLPAERGV